MNKIKKVSKLKKFIFGVLLIFGLATCSSLVTSFATSPQNASIDGIDYTFLVDPNENTATITKVDPHDKTECNIPSVLMGYPVKSIGTPTENMQDIFQIAISEDSYIPFSQCDKLKSVTIPEGVESIGSLTFMDCPNLTSVIIPNTVTSIYFYAFYNCSSIHSLTIPPSVTSIGAKTFVCDENNHLGSFFISENAQVQTLSDPDNGDSITTIVPNSTIVYKYNVLDQTNVSEGKIPVEIVSARAECNHNESSEDDIDIPDTIDCGAMGEKYAINSISFTEIKLSHNLTHFDAVDPTCTSPGNREYWYCDQCEKYFNDAQGDTEIEADSLIIEPSNHNLTHFDAVDPTCSSPGNSEYWYCDQCEKYFNGAQGETEIAENSWVIPALEHNWGNATYAWSQENGAWKCTATRVCENDASHVETETVTATSEIKTEAACTTVGTTTYTAGFENEAFATQTKDVEDIPATGHNLVHHAATLATCTSPGNREYWYCNQCEKYFGDNDATQEIEENSWIIGATGHNLAHHVATSATCTSPGNAEYWYCNQCEKYFNGAQGETEIEADSWIIGATGHAWSEISYTWSQDNSTCTATRVCGNDNSHVETETVTATSAIKTEATCTTAGTTTYTAEFENETFATQTKDVEDIPATGHNLAHHAATPATCTFPGNSEYWYCNQCEKYFGDNGATQEIEENSWIIEAAHDLQHEDKVEPTEDDDGHIAGWTCNICHKHFSDENGTQEITNWIIPHGNYQIGDVDEDGAITMQDLEALHTVLIGEKVMIKIRDDIDEDGIVTQQDLEALFQILLIQ